MKANENEWEQVKESDFSLKKSMQCITTIYSAI